MSTIGSYIAQLQSAVQNAKSFVQQNQTDLILFVAVIVLVAFAAWLNSFWKRLQVRSELRNSELIAYQLDRIAGALERLAHTQRSGLEVTRATVPVATSERTERAEPEASAAPRTAGVGSMFGLNRGMNLPNPMYRPR